MAKLVEVKLDRGDWESGFDVSLRISEDGGSPLAGISGQLPPAPNIPQGYHDWESDYRILAGVRPRGPRIKVIAAGTSSEFRENCRKSAQKLRQNMREWLLSPHREWQTITEKLRETLRQEEEVRVLIQATDPLLRQLPWQEWDVFADIYTLSEIALSFPEYKSSTSAAPGKSQAKVRILAILGDSAGIDVEADRRYLEKLTDGELLFLKEPARKELTDRLWEEEWDILFFAGHSSSRGETGKISINQNESLAVKDLKYGLKKAIKGGLRLAIFNSCDGLGLARDLEDLQMPQTIVMGEPVPDRVAQEFLKYFLKAFVDGKSLYLAVRYARERLHDDGLEDKYPGVTWLPVICQNPAAGFLTWQDLNGIDENITRKEKSMTGIDTVATIDFLERCLDREPNDKGDQEQKEVFETIQHHLPAQMKKFKEQPNKYKKELLDAVQREMERDPEFAGKLADWRQKLESAEKNRASRDIYNHTFQGKVESSTFGPNSAIHIHHK